MSDFCPCCDNFSMDSLGISKRTVRKTKPINKTEKTKKLVINVDNSDENADWIKRVRDEEQDARKS